MKEYKKVHIYLRKTINIDYGQETRKMVNMKKWKIIENCMYGYKCKKEKFRTSFYLFITTNEV